MAHPSEAPGPIPTTTHEVLNQPPPLEGHNLFDLDPTLAEGLDRYQAGWARERIRAFGERLGRPEVIALGFQANRFDPELRTHDRFGRRIDIVEFHPAWHQLMAMGVAEELHALPWNHPRDGAHVVRTVLFHLFNQVENGVNCPISMTFSGVPALQLEPSLAAEWVPRLTSTRYDPRFLPASGKDGCLLGMAMTEKQGGSDVRANTTRARPLAGGGPGAEYRLTGHKWFCSAPMCDAFLTLAQAPEGLSCFLVPRWCPDGTANTFRIQRLKDKLGNRSNASSEIEYAETWARMVGEPGRGVNTIIQMVTHTRLDCVAGAAAIMRQAVTQALHHARHRRAFGRTLVDQPAMQPVLADLALECEAATTLMLRVAHAYDVASRDPDRQSFLRLVTAVAKYWVCKRTPPTVYEALECHGGNGFVEESILPRLYREAPLNSIWEGSGNVICLDVLRTLDREPGSRDLYLEELEQARGAEPRLDRAIDEIRVRLGVREDPSRARELVGLLARVLQGALLVRHAPPAVADAFLAIRLGGAGSWVPGDLPAAVDTRSLIERCQFSW